MSRILNCSLSADRLEVDGLCDNILVFRKLNLEDTASSETSGRPLSYTGPGPLDSPGCSTQSLLKAKSTSTVRVQHSSSCFHDRKT